MHRMPQGALAQRCTVAAKQRRPDSAPQARIWRDSLHLPDARLNPAYVCHGGNTIVIPAQAWSQYRETRKTGFPISAVPSPE